MSRACRWSACSKRVKNGKKVAKRRSILINVVGDSLQRCRGAEKRKCVVVRETVAGTGPQPVRINTRVTDAVLRLRQKNKQNKRDPADTQL